MIAVSPTVAMDWLQISIGLPGGVVTKITLSPLVHKWLAEIQLYCSTSVALVCSSLPPREAN
jgi:hypothetical protein